MPSGVGRVTLLAAAALALAIAAPQARATTAARAAGSSPSIELVAQATLATAGSPFVVTIRLDGVPADGSVALDAHSRIRSRSELALSMEGEGLRNTVFTRVFPLSDLPQQPDGSRRLVLDPATGGLPLTTEGVYPLRLTAQDAAGGDLASLVTHLIVPPEAGDEAPNLAVAVLAEVKAPLALQPDGTAELAVGDRDDLAALIGGLGAAPAVPVSLSVQPETVEALLGSTDPAGPPLVADLQSAASGRTVIAEPYVPVELDALADADLVAEIGPQDQRGTEILTTTFGAAPDPSVHRADPTLGADGLSLLAFEGTARTVIDDANLEPLAEGIISYSLAQPFVVAVPADTDIDDDTPGSIMALSPDPTVMSHLTSDETPGLIVSRVIAELALIRLEQPSVARSSVVRLTPGLEAATVQQLLEALGIGRPFEAVTLNGAFDHAAPVLDGGGNPAERALLPDAYEPISDATASGVTATRADLRTFTQLVGPLSALPYQPSRHLLAATAAGSSDEEREAHLDAARGAMSDVSGAVSTPPTFTLTLTARDGTIPLTIRNDSGVPLTVRIHLSSSKLEFPDGDTIDQVLTEEVTRIDIRVRSRATGAFPLRIDVRTPDGRQSLATSRYTVRSTAVSGAGLVLSIGAGLFLTVWWARHWRRTRRAKKLIATDAHPAGTA